MKRLYDRYCNSINNEQLWALPYVWKIHYTGYEPGYSEFITYTNDIAFASMTFIAWMLKERHVAITITSMQLSGMEDKFAEVLQ